MSVQSIGMPVRREEVRREEDFRLLRQRWGLGVLVVGKALSSFPPNRALPVLQPGNRFLSGCRHRTAFL
jgi:hypothetical protein